MAKRILTVVSSLSVVAWGCLFGGNHRTLFLHKRSKLDSTFFEASFGASAKRSYKRPAVLAANEAGETSTISTKPAQRAAGI